ncbi:MAG: DUF6263 family protein [Tepidisphaeraceae bacterium]
MRFLTLVGVLSMMWISLVRADIDDDLKTLGVPIHRDAFQLTLGGAKLEGAEVPDARWEKFAPLLLAELQHYPADFLKTLKLDDFRVVIDLNVEGRSAPGGVLTDAGKVWIDAAQCDFDRRVTRRAIATGLYRSIPIAPERRKAFEDAWTKLNVAGFRYGAVNVRADRPKQLPGFFRENDVVSIERDQASVFAFLMTDVRRVAARSERDAVLTAKVKAMKALLAEVSPGFDDAFWSASIDREAKLVEDDREAVTPISRGYVPAQLAQLAARFGIEIIFTSVPGPNRIGDPVNADQLKDYAAVLTQELSRYDPAVIRALGLYRIVIVGKFAPAYANALAITMRDIDTMYFSTEGRDQEDRRCTFHHELFHVIDGVDDGELERDEAWAKTNGPSFVYVAGSEGGWQEDTPGFVTGYAKTSVGEDKAETYSYMMTRYVDMQRRAKTDPILAAKMAIMKQRLLAFQPSMDESYWTRAARDSVLLKQTYVPGRWVVTTSFDIEKDVEQYGRVAEWGGTDHTMVVGHPDGGGNWWIAIKPTRIRHTMRALGKTMVYDSSSPPEDQDVTLAKMHRFVVDQTFSAQISSDGQVREVKGFEQVLKRAEEEDDTAFVMLRGGKNNVMDALRFGCLAEVQTLLPDHAVRVGETWKGKRVMSFPPITPFELTCRCTLAKIEKNDATITVESAFDTVIKGKDDQGNETQTALKGEQGGQFTMDIRTGRVTSSDFKLNAKYKGSPTKVRLTMKCMPET